MLSKEEQNQKEYYNSIAEDYDNYYMAPYSREYRKKIYDKTFKNISLKNAVVLDAMCGGGEATEYFLKMGATVIGLDISEKCCEIYKKRYENSQIFCSSITNTPFENKFFDIVVTDSLHHTHPYLNKVMNEINRILKPNGFFHCWEPSQGSMLDLIRRLWYKLDSTYFMENEKAIDINRLNTKHISNFRLLDKTYGGSIAYLLVLQAMPLRIPSKLVKVYANFFIKSETIIEYFQNKLLSCWVSALFQKIDNSKL